MLRSCQKYAFVFVNMVLSLPEKLKDQTHNVQNISYGDFTSRIFESYNNYVKPHGCNIHNTTSYMAMAKVFTFPYTIHDLSCGKFVVRCCAKCPSIFIPGQ